MTKLDWCPADVWEAAALAQRGWASGPGDIQTACARAILAERERALEEAISAVNDERLIEPQDETDAAYERALSNAVEAIRALKETP